MFDLRHQALDQEHSYFFRKGRGEDVVEPIFEINFQLKVHKVRACLCFIYNSCNLLGNLVFDSLLSLSQSKYHNNH